MKIYLIASFLAFNAFFSHAQQKNIYKILSNVENEYTDYRTSLVLETKIRNILNHYELQSEIINPRIFLVPVVNLVETNVLRGTSPSMISKIEISIFITDPYSKISFGSYTFNVVGIGRNDLASIYDAFQNINTGKSESFNEFLKISNQKLIAHFDKNCKDYISESKRLAANNNLLEAISILMAIPSSSKNCFEEATRDIIQYYTKHQIMNCNKRLILAESYISIGEFDKAIKQLSMIPTHSDCYNETKVILAKLNDEQRRKYDNEFELQKNLIEAAKEVAIAEAVNYTPDLDVSYLIVK